MKLHENPDEFKAAIQNAAERFSLPEHVIEKDYWVTKALYNLSLYKHKDYVIFKGGTALSKGYGLIKRFSEDIDLALHPDGVGTGKIHIKETRALHKIVQAVKDANFTDDPSEKKEQAEKRFKRVYLFPKYVDYPEGSPIHSKIIIEANSFSTPVPVEKVKIKSIVGDHLSIEFGVESLIDIGLSEFEISVLKPERIFCEKLLALRRASFRGGDFFAERIRHVYDIHQLFLSARIKEWIENEKDFFQLLELAHQDDEINKKISDENTRDFASYRIFKDPRGQITEIISSYEGLKGITFDNALPEIDEVASSLEQLAKKLMKFTFR